MAASVATVVGLLTVVMAVRAEGDHVAFIERWPPPWLAPVGLGVVVLIVGSAWAMRDRPRAAAGGAVAAVGSLVPLWAELSWLPGALRAGVLAASPLAVAGVAHVLWRWSAENQRSSRPGLQATFVVAGLALLVHLLGYNPFADPGCARTCVDARPLLAGVVSTKAAVLITSSLSIVAVIMAVLTIPRSHHPPPPRPILVAGLVALSALAAAAALRVVLWGNPGTSNRLLLLQPAAVGLLGSVVCAVAARTFRTRAAVERMVSSLSGPEAALSNRGGVLGVHFAMQGGERWVDALGHDVDLAEGQAGAVLSDQSGPVLRLVLAGQADLEEVLAGITPAGRLALENARLSAVAKARLVDIQASQRRVVSALDTERRRIERDLHDGAQQRLVGVAFQLRAALAVVDSSTAALFQRPEHRVLEALERLRHLAHGMFPRVLGDEGLVAALEELVAASDVPATLDVHLRSDVGADAAMASYYTVVAALGHVVNPTTHTRVRISIMQGEGSLHLQVEAHAASKTVGSSDFVDVADRLGAIGGRITLSEAAEDGFVVSAVVPCGS